MGPDGVVTLISLTGHPCNNPAPSSSGPNAPLFT